MSVANSAELSKKSCQFIPLLGLLPHLAADMAAGD